MIHAVLHGRLGKDAQPIATKTGNPMTAASVAVSVGSRDDEATLWVRVVAFGTVAETLAQHGKGDALAAMGRLEVSHWRGNDGVERETWQLIAEQVLSTRTVQPRGGPGAGKGPSDKPKPCGKPAAGKAQEPPPFDDEIPF